MPHLAYIAELLNKEAGERQQGIWTELVPDELGVLVDLKQELACPNVGSDEPK